MGLRLLEQLKAVARQRPWLPDHGPLLLRPDRGRNTRAGYGDFDHLRAAARWLCAAQDAQSDGGVSGRYRLDRGWTSSYPETTGYLIPTFLALDKALPGHGYAGRAGRALDFLLKVQLDSGAFPGMEIAENRTEPSPFNTGQILNGLTAWHQATGDERAFAAGERAAAWLMSVQDEDGAFRKHTYLGLETAYTAHLTCWLAEWGAHARDGDALLVAERHLDWALSNVGPDGWIAKMGFGREQHARDEAFTHTIAYTLMGMLTTALIARRVDAIAVVERAAEALLELAEREGRLPGVISHWQGRSASTCLTGNAQMALVWFRLHRHARNLRFVNTGVKLLDAVKATQQMTGRNAGITGGIAGSDPISGPYIANALPNWAAKFFIDALLEKHAVLEALARTRPPQAPEVPSIEPWPAAGRAEKPLHTVLITRAGSRRVPAILNALGNIGRVTVVAENAPSSARLARLERRIRHEGFTWPRPRTDRGLAAFCRERGIALIETGALDSAEAAAAIKALKPDLGIAAGVPALPRPLLDAFRLGVVNAHMALLPHYRGADAAEWTALEGGHAGCSVHLAGDGPVLARRSVSTFACRGIGELRRTLDEAQLKLLAEVVRGVLASGALPEPVAAGETAGPRYFPMHRELAGVLQRRLGAES